MCLLPLVSYPMYHKDVKKKIMQNCFYLKPTFIIFIILSSFIVILSSIIVIISTKTAGTCVWLQVNLWIPLLYSPLLPLLIQPKAISLSNEFKKVEMLNVISFC